MAVPPVRPRKTGPIMFVAFVIVVIVAVIWMLKIQSTNALNEKLFVAISNHEVSQVKTLLDGGASANARNSVDSPALGVAVQSNKEPACSQIVALLLDHGADANGKDNYGNTVIMMAAGYGTSAAVQLLLQHGADPRVGNPTGGTALGFAGMGHHPDVIPMLKKAGETK